MNKKLIALAVASGLAAPAAVMAETTIYGRANVSIISFDDGTNSAVNISSNASRIGFKGSEDLGDGLSAIYKIEQQVNLDGTSSSETVSVGTATVDTVTHSTGWTTRNSYGGIKGGFGAVILGQHDTPFKDVRSKLDYFGDDLGDLRNLTRSGAQNGDGTNTWDERWKNMIMYTSPKFAGDGVVKVMYSTNLNNGVASGSTANDNSGLAVGLNFKTGPVGWMLAYQDQSVTSGPSPSGYRVGAKMQFGALGVRALYQSTSDNNNTSGADRDVYSVGVGFKLGGTNLLKAQYAVADDYGNANNTGANMYALGFEHMFSKKTKMYVTYASTSNDDNAKFRADGGGGVGDSIATSANGKDPSGISVGMIINF
jgi:predicted porin